MGNDLLMNHLTNVNIRCIRLPKQCSGNGQKNLNILHLFIVSLATRLLHYVRKNLRGYMASQPSVCLWRLSVDHILISHFYTIFQEIFVLSFLRTAIITPMLTNATFDPNVSSNYRPITICTSYRKLVEFPIVPLDSAHSNEFGYREGRGKC